MNKSEFEDIFKMYLNSLNLNLSASQYDMFYLYMNELLEWNKKMNLTAITEPKDVVLKHFIDCLMASKYIDGSSLIDIGTGAGFPGIPLKLYTNYLDITLLDSLNKRINFLNNIIEKVGLKNICAIHGRAEDFGKDIKYREKFDIVISRAVANMEVLSEYMLPFAKVGGICICMKGQNTYEIEQASNMIQKLGGAIELIDKYYLPNTDMERAIIIIRKIQATPTKYPRKQNQIKPKK